VNSTKTKLITVNTILVVYLTVTIRMEHVTCSFICFSWGSYTETWNYKIYFWIQRATYFSQILDCARCFFHM